MDSVTPIGIMIETLKNEFRAKGIHYHDVATHLRVSEGTIKRYLRGKAVTLAAVQRMAEMVNLDVLSLASLAQRRVRVERGVNTVQEEALAQDKHLRGALYFLGEGWTPAQIGAEFGISEQIDGLLSRLIDLGLIRKVSANSFKILARPPADYRRAGALSVRTHDRAHQFVSSLNLHDNACLWLFRQARLSPNSEVRWRECSWCA